MTTTPRSIYKIPLVSGIHPNCQQIARLRRRIASFTAEADLIEVDSAAIAEKIRAAMRTMVRSELRELLVGWIHEIHYAHDEAIVTLRVPLKPVC